MKLLLVSDVECPALWEHYQPDRLRGIDMIVSAGDLKKDYLEFLVTMSSKPVLYIPGNHDTRYLQFPPEGCECIDDTVLTIGGLRFLGLGGCKKYSEGPYQYTEAEMEKRIRKVRGQIRKAGGVDIVVTHAAVTGHGDADDYAHRGFDCFVDLIREYHPKYFIHGHVHQNYAWNNPRMHTLEDTTIINAFERYTLEIPDAEIEAMKAEKGTKKHGFWPF
ncbi:MAG: metallophosphoesterase family protein [Clostridia bacterium]|nr:metallophosphoesterase family protein [Clostridia bacterium]